MGLVMILWAIAFGMMIVFDVSISIGGLFWVVVLPLVTSAIFWIAWEHYEQEREVEEWGH